MSSDDHYGPRRDSDRSHPEARTRSTDATPEAGEFLKQRRAYRRLTVIYATAAACVFSFAINGLFYNETAGNNQANCLLTQRGFAQNYMAAQRIIDETEDSDARQRQTIARDEFAKLIPSTKNTPLGSGKKCSEQFPKKPYLLW